MLINKTPCIKVIIPVLEMDFKCITFNKKTSVSYPDYGKIIRHIPTIHKAK
jgi:hypothetical protein